MLLLLYTQMFLIFMFWKGKKKTIWKSHPPPSPHRYVFFQTPLLFQSPQLLVFDIFPNHTYYSVGLRDLRVRKNSLSMKWKNWVCILAF